jgi:hypothetical protein
MLNLRELGTDLKNSDILVIKASYVARAQQKNTKFVLHLRDDAFKPTLRTLGEDDYVIIVDCSRYPILKVCTSAGHVGYVGAIFFEKFQTDQ